jgi:hypothetical protein
VSAENGLPYWLTTNVDRVAGMASMAACNSGVTKLDADIASLQKAASAAAQIGCREYMESAIARIKELQSKRSELLAAEALNVSLAPIGGKETLTEGTA